jgi:hypothetical protein
MDPAVYSMPEVIPFLTSPAQRRETELVCLTDWRHAPEGRTESWTLADPCTAGPGVMVKHLRSMLVLEELDSDDLPTGAVLLLAGVPDTWFDPGKRIEVRDLPSFFGPVSLSCVSDDREVRIHFEAPEGKARGLRRIELPILVQGGLTVTGAEYSIAGSTLTLDYAGTPVDILARR